MDIFKQKRNLVFVIIMLVALNLALIALLWFGKPPGPPQQRGPINGEEDMFRVQQLLKNELGFDEQQAKEYLKLRFEHQTAAAQLDSEVRQLKKQMFDEVLEDTPLPILSDSLLKLIQEKQARIELLTFEHFLDLKKICKPDQQDNLKILMNEMFRQNSPPPAEDGMRPPPPPGDEPPHRAN